MRMVIQIYPKGCYTICSCDIFRYNYGISVTFAADGIMKSNTFEISSREKNYEKIVNAQYLHLIRVLSG